MSEPPATNTAAPSAAPSAVADTMPYADPSDLAAVRAFVRGRALALGLTPDRADLLMLAVSELTTNTLLYTDDGGLVRVWAEAGQLVCDVIDQGRHQAFDREMPPADALRGRGLPIVARVSDEVSTLATVEGTTVRVRLNL